MNLSRTARSPLIANTTPYITEDPHDSGNDRERFEILSLGDPIFIGKVAPSSRLLDLPVHSLPGLSVEVVSELEEEGYQTVRSFVGEAQRKRSIADQILEEWGKR